MWFSYTSGMPSSSVSVSSLQLISSSGTIGLVSGSVGCIGSVGFVSGSVGFDSGSVGCVSGSPGLLSSSSGVASLHVVTVNFALSIRSSSSDFVPTNPMVLLSPTGILLSCASELCWFGSVCFWLVIWFLRVLYLIRERVSLPPRLRRVGKPNCVTKVLRLFGFVFRSVIRSTYLA